MGGGQATTGKRGDVTGLTCRGFRGRARPWRPSDDGRHPPAAVVPIIVPPGQVGGGHEHEALVGAAVLQQDADALLAGGLPGIGQRRVSVGVAGHDVHPVLWSQQRVLSASGGREAQLPGMGQEGTRHAARGGYTDELRGEMAR